MSSNIRIIRGKTRDIADNGRVPSTATSDLHPIMSLHPYSYPSIHSIILTGNTKENGEWTSGKDITQKYSAVGMIDFIKGTDFIVDCNQLTLRKDIPVVKNPFYHINLLIDFDTGITPFQEFSVLFKWNQSRIQGTVCVPPVLISIHHKKSIGTSDVETISITNAANWSSPVHWHVFNTPGEAFVTLKVNDDCTSTVIKSMSPTLFLAV